jgi:hypothetical protein
VTMQIGAVRYRCARCGRDTADRPLAGACVCGETLRMRIDADSYALPGRASLCFDATKNWAAKYLQCTWNLRRLRSIYSDQTVADGEVRECIVRTLTSCWDLADWLVAGSEPRQITHGAIQRLAATDPLRVCRALGGGTEAQAMIVPARIRGTIRMWIEYRAPGKSPVRYDALDLADRSVAAWNAFLVAHGVPLPQWAP